MSRHSKILVALYSVVACFAVVCVVLGLLSAESRTSDEALQQNASVSTSDSLHDTESGEDPFGDSSDHIDSASPLYDDSPVDSGEPNYVSNQILVTVSHEVTEEDIALALDAVGQKMEACEVVTEDWGEGEKLLEVTYSGGMDPMDLSDTLLVFDFIGFAEPNFVLEALDTPEATLIPQTTQIDDPYASRYDSHTPDISWVAISPCCAWWIPKAITAL